MQISQSNNSLSPLFCSILYQHFLIIRLRTLFTLTSSTTDELCNHNNRPTNRHAWILFFQMPQRFPPGKGNRQQRDARAKGVRGNQKTPRLKQNRPIVDDVRELVSPSTWNTAGSSRVYFCQPKRLPSALSDRQLLCCLTRKEKKERGAEWGGWGGGWPVSFPPAGCAFPRGRSIFRSRDVMQLWETDGGNFRLYRPVCARALLWQDEQESPVWRICSFFQNDLWKLTFIDLNHYHHSYSFIFVVSTTLIYFFYIQSYFFIRFPLLPFIVYYICILLLFF